MACTVGDYEALWKPTYTSVHLRRILCHLRETSSLRKKQNTRSKREPPYFTFGVQKVKRTWCPLHDCVAQLPEHIPDTVVHVAVGWTEILDLAAGCVVNRLFGPANLGHNLFVRKSREGGMRPTFF